MKRIFAFFIVFVSLWMIRVPQVGAQTCKASAPAKVGINQTFQYNVVMEGENASVTSSNFGDFTAVGRPNRSASTSIQMSGQVTVRHEVTYTYVLKPNKLGKQTIPPVTAVIEGKQVRSNPVTIEVTQEDQRNSRQRQQRFIDPFDSFDPFDPFGMFSQTPMPQMNNERDIFLRAYPSKTNPYQGEEVVITYKLYLGVGNGVSVTSAEFPQQSDMWSYRLGNPNGASEGSQETVNGKLYRVFEVNKTAVFPQKSGTITITPLLLKGEVSVSNGFWGGIQREPLAVKSNSVTLQVKELPEAGRPANFSGLVGNFTLKSSLTKDKLKTNDATDLIVTLSGSGNLQLAEALAFNFPSDFEVNDPTITDDIHTGGNSVNGSRSFDYTIIPRAPGSFSIPAASFVYFDPKTHTYKTLTTDSYNLTVEKGEDDNGFSSSQVGINMLDKDIRYIHTDMKKLTSRTHLFFGSWWYFILLLLPLLVFIIFFIIKRKQYSDRQNVTEYRNKRASKVARRSLRKAHELLSANREEDFYEEISRALWGYMGDKFRIPLADLSIDAARAKLKEAHLPDEDIEQFVKTLSDCEFARFAPNSGEDMMSELYNESLEFIMNIERK